MVLRVYTRDNHIGPLGVFLPSPKDPIELWDSSRDELVSSNGICLGQSEAVH